MQCMINVSMPVRSDLTRTPTLKTMVNFSKYNRNSPSSYVFLS